MTFSWTQFYLFAALGVFLLFMAYLTPYVIYGVAKLWTLGKLMGRDAFQRYKRDKDRQ